MKKKHIELLFKTSELNSLLNETNGLDEFLKKIVHLIAEYMKVNVCSIYIYNEETKKLVLMATKGLNESAVGSVELKLGEGLAGLALKELSYICEKAASQSKYYKHFPNINEEKYESFLAVPILHGFNKVGVLVVQRIEKNYFTEKDILTLRALAAQLANSIEITKILINQNELKKKSIEPSVPNKKQKLQKSFYKGKPASKGIVYGKIIILYKTVGKLYQFCENNRVCTKEDFDKSLQLTKTQLKDLQKKVETKLSEGTSLIFTAHLLMLDDKKFTGAMRDLIENGITPANAIKEIGTKYIKMFSESENDYIKEKVYDVEDLMKKLLKNLNPRNYKDYNYKNKIVITRNLYPSDILKLSSQDVSGIILISGGVTSHIAILARSLKIPLVIIDNPEILFISKNSKVLIDSFEGNIFINPDKLTLKKYLDRKKAEDSFKINKNISATKLISKDKKRIELKANINLLSDINTANKFNFPEIGLYRTEFPFMIRNNFPTEDEQYIIYKKLIDNFNNKPVTFRTLDIGGDKFLNYYSDASEANPFLGLRSIRFSLSNKEIFQQQIRAILRAGYKNETSIMFPLISSIDEFTEAKNTVLEIIEIMKKNKIDINDKPKIGIMVEVPSIVAIIDAVCKEADFISIGTNDLIQYVLAADRTNAKVSSYYLPHHPAILRILKKIIDASLKNKAKATICGDMAHSKKYIPFLLGIGYTSLSIDPLFLTEVNNTIKKCNVEKLSITTNKILKMSSIKEIDNVFNNNFQIKTTEKSN